MNIIAGGPVEAGEQLGSEGDRASAAVREGLPKGPRVSPTQGPRLKRFRGNNTLPWDAPAAQPTALGEQPEALGIHPTGTDPIISDPFMEEGDVPHPNGEWRINDTNPVKVKEPGGAEGEGRVLITPTGARATFLTVPPTALPADLPPISDIGPIGRAREVDPDAAEEATKSDEAIQPGAKFYRAADMSAEDEAIAKEVTNKILIMALQNGVEQRIPILRDYIKALGESQKIVAYKTIVEIHLKGFSDDIISRHLAEDDKIDDKKLKRATNGICEAIGLEIKEDGTWAIKPPSEVSAPPRVAAPVAVVPAPVGTVPPEAVAPVPAAKEESDTPAVQIARAIHELSTTYIEDGDIESKKLALEDLVKALRETSPDIVIKTLLDIKEGGINKVHEILGTEQEGRTAEELSPQEHIKIYIENDKAKGLALLYAKTIGLEFNADGTRRIGWPDDAPGGDDFAPDTASALNVEKRLAKYLPEEDAAGEEADKKAAAARAAKEASEPKKEAWPKRALSLAFNKARENKVELAVGLATGVASYALKTGLVSYLGSTTVFGMALAGFPATVAAAASAGLLVGGGRVLTSYIKHRKSGGEGKFNWKEQLITSTAFSTVGGSFMHFAAPWLSKVGAKVVGAAAGVAGSAVVLNGMMKKDFREANKEEAASVVSWNGIRQRVGWLRDNKVKSAAVLAAGAAAGTAAGSLWGAAHQALEQMRQDRLGSLRIAADPAPVTADPAPVAADPAPVTADPAPVTADPAPVTADPAPVTADPAPVAADPAPVAADPAPVTADPAPVAADPAPVAADPAPVAADPAPVAADPAGQAGGVYGSSVEDGPPLLPPAIGVVPAGKLSELLGQPVMGSDNRITLQGPNGSAVKLGPGNTAAFQAALNGDASEQIKILRNSLHGANHTPRNILAAFEGSEILAQHPDRHIAAAAKEMRAYILQHGLGGVERDPAAARALMESVPQELRHRPRGVRSALANAMRGAASPPPVQTVSLSVDTDAMRQMCNGTFHGGVAGYVEPSSSLRAGDRIIMRIGCPRLAAA